MLPVNYAYDFVVLGDKNIVWIEVWMADSRPVEPLIFRNKLRSHLHVQVEIIEMMLRTGLSIIRDVSVDPVKRQARFSICSEPGHSFCCHTLDDVSSALGCRQIALVETPW